MISACNTVIRMRSAPSWAILARAFSESFEFCFFFFTPGGRDSALGETVSNCPICVSTCMCVIAVSWSLGNYCYFFFYKIDGF